VFGHSASTPFLGGLEQTLCQKYPTPLTCPHMKNTPPLLYVLHCYHGHALNGLRIFFSRPYGLPTSRSPSPLGSISCRSWFFAAAVLEGWPVIHPILYRHTYTCTYMYTQRHTYTHKHAHIISGHAHVFVNAWRNSTTLEGSVYSTHCDIAPGRASARTRTFQSTRNL